MLLYKHTKHGMSGETNVSRHISGCVYLPTHSIATFIGWNSEVGKEERLPIYVCLIKVYKYWLKQLSIKYYLKKYEYN